MRVRRSTAAWKRGTPWIVARDHKPWSTLSPAQDLNLDLPGLAPVGRPSTGVTPGDRPNWSCGACAGYRDGRIVSSRCALAVASDPERNTHPPPAPTASLRAASVPWTTSQSAVNKSS